MYTATKLGDSVNKEMRRRIVTIRFENPDTGHVYERDYQFDIKVTETEMKLRVKQEIDDNNYEPVAIPDGVIDFSDIDVTPPPPTAEEIAKQQYEEAKAALVVAKQEYDIGLITKAEYDALVASTKGKKV